MIDLVAECGYQVTSVTDLLQRAAVSRGSFYELFDNKDGCLLYAYETHTTRAEAEVGAAYRTPGLDGVGSLRAAITALMDYVIAWPAAAIVCTSEMQTAGAHAVKRHQESIAAYQTALDQALRRIDRPPLPAEITLALVEGIAGVIDSLVRAQQEQRLRDLTDPLVDWLLVYDRSPAPAETTVSALERSSTGATPLRPPDAPTAQADQRQRITTAVLAIASTKGYSAMTYRDIATEAKISLTTFYKHFRSKHDAFLATFDVCADQIRASTLPSLPRTGIDLRAVHGAIAALLEFFSGNPDIARLVLVEIYNAGTPGVDRLEGLVRQYSAIPVLEGKKRLDLSPELSRAVVSGIAGTLTSHVRADAANRLPRLLPQLTYLVLAPLVGSEQAFDIVTG
jgi:AcrR family transcriptional regulator